MIVQGHNLHGFEYSKDDTTLKTRQCLQDEENTILHVWSTTEAINVEAVLYKAHFYRSSHETHEFSQIKKTLKA